MSDSARDPIEDIMDDALKKAGEERRAILEETRAAAPPPGEEKLLDSYRDIMNRNRAPASRAGRRPRVWVWMAASAAALLLVAAVLNFVIPDPEGDGAPPRIPMGSSGALNAVSPKGAVQEFSEFRWKTVDAAASYQVLVYEADPATTKPLAESPLLDGDRWDLEDIDASAWPDRIRWEVVAYDAGGQPIARRSETAWRSP